MFNPLILVDWLFSRFGSRSRGKRCTASPARCVDQERDTAQALAAAGVGDPRGGDKTRRIVAAHERSIVEYGEVYRQLAD